MRRRNLGIDGAENAAAVDVELTPDDLGRLDDIAPMGVAAGSRYPEAGMRAAHR